MEFAYSFYILVAICDKNCYIITYLSPIYSLSLSLRFIGDLSTFLLRALLQYTRAIGNN